MKSFAKILLGTVAGLATVGTAQADSLFTDLALDESVTSTEFRSQTAFKSRQVMIHAPTAETVFAAADPAESLNLDLFPGASANLKMTGFDRNIGEGAMHWSGSVEGFEHGYASLTYYQGRLSGQIQMDSDVFTINPVGYSGLHEIAELDLTTLPDEAPALSVPQAALDAAPPPVAYQSFWSPRIRVLFIYTDDAETEAIGAGTNIVDESIATIALANTALANTALTGQRYKFAAARTVYCPYDENAGSYSTLLSDVTDTSTCFGARVLTLRDNVGADLVAVIRESAGSTSCGVAWVLEGGGPATFGYSLTSRFCIPGHTATHEIGHNMGLSHDRYVSGTSGDGKYNYGYTREDLPSPVRTVQAYNTACSAAGVSCTRVPLFSNTHPMGKWMGDRLGKGTHSPDAAVSRKKLLDNWNSIAAFR